MPYLNLDPNYPDHPKTSRLCSVLGDLADAFPIRLWSYCARIHPKNGAMRGYSVPHLERVIKWHGTEGAAVRALIEVGFIKRLKNGFVCIDWKQHQGHLEEFSRRAKSAAKARWSRDAPSNATSMRQAMLKANSSNAPSSPTTPEKKISIPPPDVTILATAREPFGQHRFVRNLSIEEVKQYYYNWHGRKPLYGEFKRALETRISMETA